VKNFDDVKTAAILRKIVNSFWGELHDKHSVQLGLMTKTNLNCI
jgi:hypothetical protein